MSVSTQLLFASVANSIETLKELGLPEFQQCGATVEFIQVCNNLMI